MSSNLREYYRGGREPVLESSLRIAPDIMTREQFHEFDRRQEERLIETSRLFSIQQQDQDLKSFASKHLRMRFRKGDRQFCAAAYSGGEEPIWDLQQDQRLGNGSTCAERFLLEQSKSKGRVVEEIVAYRGENVETVPLEDGKRKMQTLQKLGGVDEMDVTDRAIMTHMVCPCAYCREGICNQNQTAMVIMPPGILRVGQNTLKLPAFIVYPEDDLLQRDDPLEKRLRDSSSLELLEARRMQKEFFKNVAKEHPLTDADRELLKNARRDFEKAPLKNKPHLWIQARTITDQTVKVDGPVAEPVDPTDYSYLQYTRNDVEVKFVHDLLEEPHFPPARHRHPGSSHSLHVFLELYRKSNSSEGKLILPNADTRQRMVERFIRSFILVELDGEVVKLPFILLYPNRYKRLDKADAGGRV